MRNLRTFAVAALVLGLVGCSNVPEAEYVDVEQLIPEKLIPEQEANTLPADGFVKLELDKYLITLSDSYIKNHRECAEVKTRKTGAYNEGCAAIITAQLQSQIEQTDNRTTLSKLYVFGTAAALQSITDVAYTGQTINNGMVIKSYSGYSENAPSTVQYPSEATRYSFTPFFLPNNQLIVKYAYESSVIVEKDKKKDLAINFIKIEQSALLNDGQDEIISLSRIDSNKFALVTLTASKILQPAEEYEVQPETLQ